MGPETFRCHADECERLAQKADDPEYKSLLLSMAQTWVVLADSAEKVQTLLERREEVSYQQTRIGRRSSVLSITDH
jgi:hypothetical protein